MKKMKWLYVLLATFLLTSCGTLMQPYQMDSSGVTQGITELNLMYDIPFIFGLLTTDTMQQSEDRAGGKYGNKGDEAAVTALKMVNFSA